MNGSKHTHIFIRSALILTALILLIFNGCRKEENKFISYHLGINSSQQFVFAQQMMSQLMLTYLKTIHDSSFIASGETVMDGAIVRLIEGDKNRIFFEYPPWGTNDGYGHWRMSTFEAITDSSFDQAGAEITFQFNNFSWDKNQLTVDSLRLRNMGRVDGENLQYHFQSGEIKVVYEFFEDSSYFSMNQYFELNKDPSTPYNSVDDQYQIWGSLSGKTDMEALFNTDIGEDSALIQQLNCNWLKQGPGIVNVDNFGFPSMVYFPPPDSCENQYLVEINGNPFPYPIDKQ